MIIGYIITSAQQYTSIISFHGIFMIFIFVMPILIGGFGNILLPIMLGCSDLLFPRLNALSVWLFVLSLLLILISLSIDNGVDCGWTFYVLLSSIGSSSIDYLFFTIHLSGISSISGSINFLITIISRQSFNVILDWYWLYLTISLYLWSILVTSILLLLSLPVLASSVTLILLDRYYNSCFFSLIFGGDALLFQHSFWFFGHFEVYILILPAFGLIMDIVTRSSNTIIFSRDSMINAIFSIGVIGFMVWGYYMFNVGFDLDTRAYYSSSTSIIAILTGIKIFNWTFTLWFVAIELIVDVFSIIFDFLFSFPFDDLMGILLFNALLDILFYDTYFIVGYFHYVLSLGALYSIFAAIYMYFLHLLSFPTPPLPSHSFLILLLLSSNLLFLPMHSIGLMGHSRRIFDYPLLFSSLHYLQSLGISGVSFSIVLLSLSL